MSHHACRSSSDGTVALWDGSSSGLSGTIEEAAHRTDLTYAEVPPLPCDGSAEECTAAGGSVGGARQSLPHRSAIPSNQETRAQAAAALVGAYQVWEKSAAPAHAPAAPAESFSADEQDRINRKVRADLLSPPAKR